MRLGQFGCKEALIAASIVAYTGLSEETDETRTIKQMDKVGVKDKR